LSQFDNNTVREMESTGAAELAQEQAYLTMLYERLDALRADTVQRLAAVRLGPTAENDQGWSERESFAERYQDRAVELDAAERNLCFGRLDFDDGDRLYIGRLGLRSEGHDLLLADWRARAAEPFYRATPRQRYAVTRRHPAAAVRRDPPPLPAHRGQASGEPGRRRARPGRGR
jgi:DNA helicase IV